MKTIKWIARILALVILVFALPFYFGYGNPLPFASVSYSLWENASLIMIPIMFLGLALGWKYPKIGGLLVLVSSLVILLLGIFTKSNLSINLLIPIIPGILYLMQGCKENK